MTKVLWSRIVLKEWSTPFLLPSISCIRLARFVIATGRTLLPLIISHNILGLHTQIRPFTPFSSSCLLTVTLLPRPAVSLPLTSVLL